MASAFSRTMRSIETEPSRRNVARFLVALAVLGAWCAWMALARVAVYATSQAGRLQVSRMAHRVASQEVGRHDATELEVQRRDARRSRPRAKRCAARSARSKRRVAGRAR
jgi:hypothetical protein